MVIIPSVLAAQGIRFSPMLERSESALRKSPSAILTAAEGRLCRCEMADGGFVRLVAWEEGAKW